MDDRSIGLTVDAEASAVLLDRQYPGCVEDAQTLVFRSVGKPRIVRQGVERRERGPRPVRSVRARERSPGGDLKVGQLVIQEVFRLVRGSVEIELFPVLHDVQNRTISARSGYGLGQFVTYLSRPRVEGRGFDW